MCVLSAGNLPEASPGGPTPVVVLLPSRQCKVLTFWEQGDVPGGAVILKVGFKAGFALLPSGGDFTPPTSCRGDGWLAWFRGQPKLPPADFSTVIIILSWLAF